MLGTMKRLSLLLLMIGLPVSALVQADGAAGDFWIDDPISGCALWTHVKPIPGEAPSWSGGCAEGRTEGSGVLSWYREQQLWGRYTGRMQAGKVSGLGDLWIQAKNTEAGHYDHYRGSFARGRLNGHAVLERWNGDHFEGRFEDGVIQGYGSYVAASGDRYDGEFLDGKPHGPGYFVSAAGEHYRGEFNAGERHGEGTLLDANGDRYSGPFVNGKAMGQGRFTKQGGGVYVGGFVDGKPQGQGEYTAPDGQVYRGAFLAGRPDGAIQVSSPDGAVIEQQWRNGERVNGEKQP